LLPWWRDNLIAVDGAPMIRNSSDFNRRRLAMLLAASAASTPAWAQTSSSPVDQALVARAVAYLVGVSLASSGF
jgi:hypothetical protein